MMSGRVARTAMGRLRGGEGAFVRHSEGDSNVREPRPRDYALPRRGGALDEIFVLPCAGVRRFLTIRRFGGVCGEF